MTDPEKEREKVNNIFEKDNFIQVDPDTDFKFLTAFDLYKKIRVKGKDQFVLFHKGKTPLEHEIPGGIYLKESSVEELLKLTPNIKFTKAEEEVSEPEKVSDNIFHILLNDQFQTLILNNPELDLEKKIEITVHSAGEVMKKIFEDRKLDHDTINLILKVGDNICYLIELVFQDNKTLNLLLNEIIGHDYRLYTHCVNVSFYSGLLAIELANNSLQTLEADQLKILVTGSLLHDIGKILIDSKIIDKLTPLSPKEFEEIKRHPVYGIKLVEQEKLSEEVLNVILQHHEKWTGGGYPYNISYQQISNFARIACISDVFDALTTKKPYRPALKPFEALLLMKQQMIGKFYHPYLNVFIKFLGRSSRK